MRGRVGRPDQAPTHTADYNIKTLHQYAFQSSPRPHIRRARRRCSSKSRDLHLLGDTNKFSRLKTRNRTARLIWARILRRFPIRVPTSHRLAHFTPRPLQAAHRHHLLVPILLRCLLLPNLMTKAQAGHAVLTLLHRRCLVLSGLIQESVLFRPRPVPSRHHHPRPLFQSRGMWTREKHAVRIPARRPILQNLSTSS